MKLIRKTRREKNKNGNWVYYGIYQCPNPICNKQVERSLSNGGTAKSCGCTQHTNNPNYKHGETNTRLYKTWQGTKSRCFYLKDKDYKNYGGRGIIVCPEWVNDYIAFRDWSLSNGYADNLEIDRINTNGNYEPNNCRFVTRQINAQNKNNNVVNIQIVKEIRDLYITGNYTQKELVKIYNINRRTVSDIINNKSWINKGGHCG